MIFWCLNRDEVLTALAPHPVKIDHKTRRIAAASTNPNPSSRTKGLAAGPIRSVGFRHADQRELSGISSTADGLLAAYRTDSALRAARQPNFDPDRFAASTDSLYLVSPGATQHLHAALVVALLDRIRTAATWEPQVGTLCAGLPRVERP
jgi:hypothetical protein